MKNIINNFDFDFDLTISKEEMENIEKEVDKMIEDAEYQQEHGKPLTELQKEIYKEKNLLKRTKLLKKAQMFEWYDSVLTKDDMEIPNAQSDMNRLEFLNILFDRNSGRVPHPYYDTFRQSIITHDDKELNEINSPVAQMSLCMREAGMRNPKFSAIDDTYKRFASQCQKNSLTEKFEKRIEKWDGQERLENFLILFFKLRDTELNRKVGKYFWLSLYKRITDPGCYAPVSVAFIGDQGVGKSFLGVKIVRSVMGNSSEPVDVSLYDISRNANDLLRRLTGKSIIANVGEMRGHKKADVEEIKSFSTRTSDVFHQKFMSAREVPRQWIIMLDSNSYDGFNRDETGNRRFYPMFVNQIEDKNGQPNWLKNGDWTADFTFFDQNFWLLMNEAAHFCENNDYVKFARDVSKEVAEFNFKEIKKGRGIIEDESTEAALRDIIMRAEFSSIKAKHSVGTFISNAEIQKIWNMTQKKSINFKAIKRIMTACGFEQKLIYGYGRGYLLNDVMDIKRAKFIYWMGGVENIDENSVYSNSFNENYDKYNENNKNIF